MTINKTPNLGRGREYKTTIYIAKNERDTAGIWFMIFYLWFVFVLWILTLSQTFAKASVRVYFIGNSFFVNTYVCRLML